MDKQDTLSNRQGFQPTKAQLYEWLDTQTHGVLSTVGNDGFPNGALVGFSQTKDLEFLLFTDELSRKVQNIARSDKVAFTISSEKELYTVQIEGYARRISEEELAPLEAHHYQKLPFAAKSKGVPGRISIIITPTHIRFTDISIRPWQLTSYVF